MISPVATIAQKALMNPYCTSSVAPTASRIRNEAAPNAVLATRHSDQRRKRCGVERSAQPPMVSVPTHLLESRRTLPPTCCGAASPPGRGCTASAAGVVKAQGAGMEQDGDSPLGGCSFHATSARKCSCAPCVPCVPCVPCALYARPVRRPGTGLARHAEGADARDPTPTRTDTTPAAAHGPSPARKRQVADLHRSPAGRAPQGPGAETQPPRGRGPDQRRHHGRRARR